MGSVGFGGGSLSSSALAAAPGLSLEGLDVNSDQQISADEIAARIRAWQDSSAGMMSHHLTVFMDGKLLEGAKVKLEPYPFLGSAVLEAGGVTDQRGTVTLSVLNEGTVFQRARQVFLVVLIALQISGNHNAMFSRPGPLAHLFRSERTTDAHESTRIK